jgi:hypothetical protein
MSPETMDALKLELSDFVTQQRNQLNLLARTLTSPQAIPRSNGSFPLAPVTMSGLENNVPETRDSHCQIARPLAAPAAQAMPSQDATVQLGKMSDESTQQEPTPETDPMARLNAIKLRLSKQIAGR